MPHSPDAQRRALNALLSGQAAARRDVQQAALEALQQALDGTTRVVVLVTGEQTNGRPFWAYVAMAPTDYLQFRQREAAGAGYSLHDFGEILEAGEASQPPPSVVQRMAEEEGFDPGFEARLKAFMTGT